MAMKFYNCNECKGFELNTKTDSLIWRYMSLDKLESLLKNQALYFASARQLNDEHQGSITDEELKSMFDLDFSKIIEHDFNLMKKFYKHFRFVDPITDMKF
jgi:hypothetical protein